MTRTKRKPLPKADRPDPAAATIRPLLLRLLRQVMPEADNVVVAVDRGLGYSFVRLQDPPRPARPPRGPVIVARKLLRRNLRKLFPDVVKAGVVFFRKGETIGVLETEGFGRVLAVKNVAVSALNTRKPGGGAK